MGAMNKSEGYSLVQIGASTRFVLDCRQTGSARWAARCSGGL